MVILESYYFTTLHRENKHWPSLVKTQKTVEINDKFWSFLILANIEWSLENCPLDANKNILNRLASNLQTGCI